MTDDKTAAGVLNRVFQRLIGRREYARVKLKGHGEGGFICEIEELPDLLEPENLDEIEIEYVFMTRRAYENLPEFMGF